MRGITNLSHLGLTCLQPVPSQLAAPALLAAVPRCLAAQVACTDTHGPDMIQTSTNSPEPPSQPLQHWPPVVQPPHGALQMKWSISGSLTGIMLPQLLSQTDCSSSACDQAESIPIKHSIRCFLHSSALYHGSRIRRRGSCNSRGSCRSITPTWICAVLRSCHVEVAATSASAAGASQPSLLRRLRHGCVRKIGARLHAWPLRSRILPHAFGFNIAIKCLLKTNGGAHSFQPSQCL